MRRAIVTAAVVLAVSAAFSTPVIGQSAAVLKVGDMAPDFTLPASDGRTYTLTELRGRHVVLAWFPKAFTAG